MPPSSGARGPKQEFVKVWEIFTCSGYPERLLPFPPLAFCSFPWVSRSSSSLSTSFWSFWTDLSANSALASASLHLAVRDRSCSEKDSSFLEAFSSETSRDLRLFPTTLNSSSNSTILDSPVSALSSALSRSASTMANFLATSSYFLSASSAKNLASFNWFSRASILSSSDRERFSSTFLIRSDSSAACEASASFCVAVASLSSDLSRSSSSSWILLFRAVPSPSSRRQISSWSFLAMSSDSSLYFSISSLVCLIFFLRTSKRLLPCTAVMLHCWFLTLDSPC